MATLTNQREIELHTGEQPRRRVHITGSCSTLVVPVKAANGYGQISYMASGLRTEDGIEIWVPQPEAVPA